MHNDYVELGTVSLIIALFVLIENTIALTWLGKRMSADHKVIMESFKRIDSSFKRIDASFKRIDASHKAMMKEHRAMMQSLERISERLATSRRTR